MIWLAQLLCPESHAIIAVAYGGQLKEATQSAEQAFASGLLNRRCGICGSTVLSWHARATKWKSLEEAMPTIRQCQEDQMATRAFLDLQGLTADSQQHRRN